MLKKFIKPDHYYAVGPYPQASSTDYANNLKAYVLTTKGSLINEKYDGTYDAISLIGGNLIIVAIQDREGWWRWRKVTPSHFVMPWEDYEPKLNAYKEEHEAAIRAEKKRNQDRKEKFLKLNQLIRERAKGHEPKYYTEYSSYVEISVDDFIAILENTLPSI